jgi:hypothetical protein
MGRTTRVRSRARAIRLACVLSALLVPCLAAARADAYSGFQIGPDGGHGVISRDVQGARWSIVQDRSDGILIGNVFFQGGGPPQFVWCEPIGVVENDDPGLASYTYDCFGSSTCDPESCPDWVFVSTVELSGTFFEPPPFQPTPGPTATPAATPTPAACVTPPPSSPTPAPAPTPKPTPTPKPAPTPKPQPLVVTPGKASVTYGGTFLFVVTGGVPPYELNVTTGGSVAPKAVPAAGDAFVFTASAAGTSTIIVVDSTTTLTTVDVTVKPTPTPKPPAD